MRKEAKLLLEKAINSQILSIEHFNRPWDCGRPDAILILLDHSFEMLLKAAIIHRGGKIRKPGAKQTIGFDECLSKALTNRKVKFLNEEQVVLVQGINSLRDAAQHHLVYISERHLYIQAQAGLTLFRAILKDVFVTDFSSKIPERVLPLSTKLPTDLLTVFEDEVKEIEQLLRPGKRQSVEILARLRGLAIIDGAVIGEKLQPSDDELNRIGNEIRAGHSWDQIFPGIASINITTSGYGPSIDLQITKDEGIKVQLVPEGTPGATIVGVKRVNELGFYNLGRDQLAKKIGLSGPKITAIIRYLGIQSDPDCFKEFTIGKSKHQRYSQKAITKIKDLLKNCSAKDIEDIWKEHGLVRRRK
jgi:hypothetical protein